MDMLRPDAGISAILKQRADAEDRNFERTSDREQLCFGYAKQQL
jgi:hypothetical protein